MLSKKMLAALNDQLNFELFSAYQYAATAAYFEGLNLGGCAHWMKIQVQEEMTHAQMFYSFIIQTGGRVELEAVAKPANNHKSPIAAFQDTYRHETQVTARIHKLVDLALKESDHATNSFLQWFVTEQVEEEAAADAIVKKLKLIGADTSGLFFLDRELAARTVSAAASGAGAQA
ncbi:MAG: ferritin [Candidatus Hydrogenedentes bacterium]|nr:ferritin [Candidatus Hydrogenedentota bacterium]